MTKSHERSTDQNGQVAAKSFFDLVFLLSIPWPKRSNGFQQPNMAFADFLASWIFLEGLPDRQLIAEAWSDLNFSSPKSSNQTWLDQWCHLRRWSHQSCRYQMYRKPLASCDNRRRGFLCIGKELGRSNFKIHQNKIPFYNTCLQ